MRRKYYARRLISPSPGGFGLQTLIHDLKSMDEDFRKEGQTPDLSTLTLRVGPAERLIGGPGLHDLLAYEVRIEGYPDTNIDKGWGGE